MSIVEIDPPNDHRPTPPQHGGMYDIPVVGDALGAIRTFYDGMAPTPDDNMPVTVAKQIVRYGSVVVVGAAAAVVIL